MPSRDPNQYDNFSDWMGYCIAVAKDEDNKSQQEAKEMCAGIWNDKKDDGEEG